MIKVRTRVTKINSNFLVIVIVAGIFTTLFPLFITGVEAQAPIKVGDGPSGIAYDSLNKRMYVSNFRDDTVSVIDTVTNTLVGNPIKVGKLTEGIAYDPVNKGMYVTNRGDNTVSVINIRSDIN